MPFSSANFFCSALPLPQLHIYSPGSASLALFKSSFYPLVSQLLKNSNEINTFSFSFRFLSFFLSKLHCQDDLLMDLPTPTLHLVRSVLANGCVLSCLVSISL